MELYLQAQRREEFFQYNLINCKCSQYGRVIRRLDKNEREK